MKITTSNLIRFSGLALVPAGLVFAGIQPIHPPDVLSSVNTSAFIIITSLKTAMSLFGLFGIAGLYARQVEETGWLGLAASLYVDGAPSGLDGDPDCIECCTRVVPEREQGERRSCTGYRP